jgi:SHS2 domain-containing protein
VPYDFIDNIATADIAFTAWGETIEEMFASAADATTNVMVSNLDAIERRERRELEARSDAIDMLLFDLLQEIIYFKDAERLLLRVEDVRISYTDGLYRLNATGLGEEVDPDKHDLIVDVKAVTLHRFKVEQTPIGWEALVILDV